MGTLSDDQVNIVCLTPVKNEEWILNNFLSTNSLWADTIIIADQFSTDKSKEICKSFDKVKLISNPNIEYNEQERQNLLIQTARSLPDPRILIALDADEILSANFSHSTQWEAALKQPPGTIIEFPRVNLWGDTQNYFHIGYHPFGYVDDGHIFQGTTIHSVRMPLPQGAPRFRLEDIVILHFQFCDLPRMSSKHRWYRCYERVKFPDKSSKDINWLYSWMYRNERTLENSKPEWFEMYNEMGIKLDDYTDIEIYWWDWEILRMFETYGQKLFDDLDIWDVDWEQIRQTGLQLEKTGLPQKQIDQAVVVAYTTY